MISKWNKNPKFQMKWKMDSKLHIYRSVYNERAREISKVIASNEC